MVAETLGMMVWDIEENMPIDEFYEWLAYFEFKSEMEKKAYDKAKRKGR